MASNWFGDPGTSTRTNTYRYVRMVPQADGSYAYLYRLDDEDWAEARHRIRWYLRGITLEDLRG